MRVSVILATYNQPRLLEMTLWGYAAQSHRNFEVLIADDGSTGETADTIRRLRKETGLEIHHVWHEHQGFRKCTILNRAIAAATADYLVFSDGDCVPRWDFLAQHVRHAREGCLLSGGCLRLPRGLTERITKDDILQRRVTRPAWLLRHGMNWSHKLLKLCFRPSIGRVLDALTPTRPTFNGHNASAWRADVLRVNGYDERMVYGGLDRELGERLMNLGVRPRQVRHRAVCLHLWHPRDYVTRQGWDQNDRIRDETRRQRHTWTPHGIEKRTDRPAAFDARSAA